MIKTLARSAAAAAALFSLTVGANAALVPFQQFNGNVAISTDGFGSTSGNGVIRASAPSGSTVLAAYLYTSTFSSTLVPSTVSFDGNAIAAADYTALGSPASFLQAHRTDVTSIVAAAIDGGGGGIYNFDIAEGAQNNQLDGHALVVVYENPALPDASVGVLDGFAALSGDTTSINFSTPLDTSDPDFFAEMSLGIGFSCCNQASTVEINGNLLTENAGNNDDGNAASNGSLITVGSFDDPFSPVLPSYTEDTERYDLAASGFISNGDTTITVDTRNPSNDDNIFLATFYVSGDAGFNAPPPPPPGPAPIPLPASGWLLILAAGGLAGMRRMTK